MNFFRKLWKKLQILRKVLVRYEALETEVKELREQVEKLTKQQKGQKKRYNELNQRLQIEDSTLRATKDELQSISGQVSDASQKIVEFNQKYNELSQKHNGLEQRVASESNALKATNAKVQNISGQVSDTRNMLNKYKNENNLANRNLEYKIRRYMPEEKYEKAIEDWYYEVTGKNIDIRNPKTFNELIQWGKIYDNTEIRSRLADKYEVREWVAERIGEQHLIPLLGVWDRAEDIDFTQLPDKFVLKCNHGSAYNIIVRDKTTLDEAKTRKQLNDWLHEDYAFKGFELHYQQIKPRIIAEKDMLEERMEDLPDYKFFCFGGRVFCSYTMIDCAVSHANGRLGFFDREYNLMPYHRKEFKPITEQIEKPQNYDKMIELAEILAEGFPHVRVDFYNVDGKIYFGEMTFTTANGRGIFEPEEFDCILGEQWLKYLPEVNGIEEKDNE